MKIPSEGLDQKNIQLTLDRYLKEEKEIIGVKVVSVESGEIIYQRNADKVFTPASTVKLVTTAAALEILQPSYRFRTEIRSDTNPNEEGALSGNLYLKGYGDPWLVSEQMWLLVNDLTRTGIKKILGNLVLDDSAFETYAKENKTLKGERAFEAEPSALSFNFNSTTVFVRPSTKSGSRAQVFIDPPSEYIQILNRAKTVSSKKKTRIQVSRLPLEQGDQILVTGEIGEKSEELVFFRAITDPTLYTGLQFKAFLENRGIRLMGKVVRGLTSPSSRLLLSHFSPPLSQVIGSLNKFSNNMMAELLLFEIGGHKFGFPATKNKGLIAVREFLTEKVKISDDWNLSDGSGIGRENKLSPTQIVTLLQYMYGSFSLQPIFLSSLAAPTEHGTLSERLRDPHLLENVRGKTGSLDGVSCLSGYMNTKKGERIIFSLMINAQNLPKDQLDRMIDTISLVIANLNREKG